MYAGEPNPRLDQASANAPLGVIIFMAVQHTPSYALQVRHMLLLGLKRGYLEGKARCGHLEKASARQALVQGKESSLSGVPIGRPLVAEQCCVLHMQMRREPVAGPQLLQQLLCRRTPQAVVRDLHMTHELCPAGLSGFRVSAWSPQDQNGHHK